jgi:hypothetical protein
MVGPLRAKGASVRRIGATFQRAAMGPVDYAAGCILSNKIEAGLNELAPEALLAGYQRGLGEVAALVGVPRREVDRLLPEADVERIGQRLLISQENALRAWRLHAGPFGFMDVITALTVDGRSPDVALCLDRLAQKVRQDPALALPLSELARDMAAYTDLVSATQSHLEEGEWLARALRRRQLQRVVFGSIALLLLVGLTSSVVWLRIAREDARARVLAATDCSAADIPTSELGWAEDETLAARDRKIATCEEERRRAEEERLKVEEEERRAREAREKIERRLAQCKELADAVTAGALTETARATAGDAAPLFGRVAEKKLTALDYGPLDPTIPCSDTMHGARLQAALEQALLREPALWARHPEPSPFLAKALVAARPALPETALIGLADNTERTSKSGLARGERDVIARAKRLCALADSLGVSGHSGCSAVKNLP